MQDDLIERLRDAGFVLVSPGMRKLANDAADRIEALEAEVDRLLRRRSKNYEPFWENPDGPNAA